MKIKILILALLPFFADAQKDTNTIYGLLINGSNAIGRLFLAQQVGIKFFRVNTFVSDLKNNQAYAKKLSSLGNKLAITEQWIDQLPDTMPQPFAIDLVRYAKDLNNNLDFLTPEIAVIENEESNDSHHTGTAEQYIAQLSTAIDVCHARGIKVTNGGLTSVDLIYLYAKDLLDSGHTRAYANLKIQTGVDTGKQQYKDKIGFDTVLINAYKVIPIDFINYHWYEPTKKILRGSGDSSYSRLLYKVVDFLQRATGKQAMSNEIGVLTYNTGAFDSLLHNVARLKMPYVIFNAGHTDIDYSVAYFYNNDFTLNELGEAFKQFLLFNGKRQ